MAAKKQPTKRPVGRPKSRPDGAKLRGYWATDAEYQRLRRDAAREDTSVQELVRRRVLAT